MRTKGTRDYGGYNSGGKRGWYDDEYNPRSYGYGHSAGYGGEMSLASYNGLIGIILLYGFGVNYLLVKFCADTFMALNPWALIIGYFVLAIIGMLMSAKSDNPVVSFIGYNLVVLPVGAVLSVCLSDIAPDLIMHVVTVTVGVTLVMLIAGTLFPRAFMSIGRALFIALLAVIIIELICMLFGVFMPTFWDFIVALIFCGYIGYDWAVAQQEYRTLDNAIDACVGLYLDIVNLFLRLLSIESRRRD